MTIAGECNQRGHDPGLLVRALGCGAENDGEGTGNERLLENTGVSLFADDQEAHEPGDRLDRRQGAGQLPRRTPPGIRPASAMMPDEVRQYTITGGAAPAPPERGRRVFGADAGQPDEATAR